MKIIELAPYAHFRDHKEFGKTTGAAFAISDIAEGLAVKNHVLLLTQSAITRGFESNNILVVKKTWLDIFKGIKASNVIDGIKAGNGISASFIYRLKLIYYFVSQGHTEMVLKKEKPDIAHIESIGFYTLPYIRACINCKIPFVITSHGLSSFLDDSEIDQKQKRLEKEVFKLSDQKGILISCVSGGMIERMKNAFGLEGGNIRRIGNCVGRFDDADEKKVIEIKKRYDIEDSHKVVICLGSICERKNQEQVARAYALLNNEKREKIKLLFIGMGSKEKEIKKFAKDNNLSNIVFTGFIAHEQLANYYSIADVNITASKDEGFGLPIIEAYTYGIPTVAFRDIDAANDLKFEHGIYLAENRSDECLCKTLLEALADGKNFKNSIIKNASKYSKEAIANEYLRLFNDAINRSLSQLTLADLEGLI